jgi:hypothetical protein
MEVLERFVLNHFFGTMITFYGSLLLLFPFRPLIRSSRALYFFYLFPLIKTASDLFIFSHKNWVYRCGDSILNQAENSRFLSALVGYEGAYPLVSLKCHLTNGHLFSLGDIFFEFFPPIVPFILSTLIIGGTLVSLGLFIIKSYSSFRFSQNIRKNLVPWKIIKGSPVYLTYHSLQSPFLLGLWNPLIIFPEKLASKLSDEEIEAIFTHENSHLLWKDNLMQWIILFLQTLFWFIPFKNKWLRKAHFYREVGCDQECQPEALMRAIVKTGIAFIPPIGIAFSHTYHRIQRTAYRKKEGKGITYLSFIVLLGGGALIFLSQFFPF